MYYICFAQIRFCLGYTLTIFTSISLINIFTKDLLFFTHLAHSSMPGSWSFGGHLSMQNLENYIVFHFGWAVSSDQGVSIACSIEGK